MSKPSKPVLILTAAALLLAGGCYVFATAHAFKAFNAYYFVPNGEPWWKGAVWGNVLAILPSAPVIIAFSFGAYFLHKSAVAPLHEKIDALEKAHVAAQQANADHHDEHMQAVKNILDALDPTTESDSVLDVIADRVDETTPGGLGRVRELLEGGGATKVTGTTKVTKPAAAKAKPAKRRSTSARS